MSNLSKRYIPIDKVRANSMLLTLSVITIICCSFLKFFGYKEFEIPIDDIDINMWVRRFIYCSLFIINGVIFSLLFIKRKLTAKELLFIILINLIDYLVTYYIQSFVYMFIDLATYFIIVLYLKKCKIKFKDIVETIYISIIIIVLQMLSMFYKNVNINFHVFEHFIDSIILQIDYYIVLVLLVINCFRKGGYLYERHWWKTILVFLPKRKRTKERLEQNESNVCEEVDIGFKVFVVLLSVAQFVIVGTLCYFINDALFEYIAIFISFVFMRYVFGKSYHADKIIKCTMLAIIVFLIATRASLPPWVSVLCNVLLGCCIAYIMYIWYYYAEYTSVRYITLYKGMPLDELILYCKDRNLNELETKRLELRYVHSKTYKEIADIEKVEIGTIKVFFQRLRQKIE